MAVPMEQALLALRMQFGYDSFRPGQKEVVEALLAGRDALAVMPTGSGKSICYQIPAIVQTGTALVISPLVSLMADQVKALRDLGIQAAYLNSTLSPFEQSNLMSDALDGRYDLIYVAPERLDDTHFVEFARKLAIPLIAVDEAHCVSQWGQDFRPSYLRISDFIQTLPKRPPLAALTATATTRVRKDIVRLLGMRDPSVSVTGFDRPNLHFSVERLEPSKKLSLILGYVRARQGQCGVIYCSTRKNVEKVHCELVGAGLSATRYHAGLDAVERKCNQRSWIDDDVPVIVATNAFGMGIDKPDVRFVIHYNMPGSIEAYYQEAGRAGRDGDPAECILLWSDGDLSTARFLLEQASPEPQDDLSPESQQNAIAARRRMLASMEGYCLTCTCLRRYILDYFDDDSATSADNGSGAIDAKGSTAYVVDEMDATAIEGGGAIAVKGSDPSTADLEGASAPKGTAAPAAGRVAASGGKCGNCSNCDGHFTPIDVTDQARAVMRCVQELRGRFGKGVVADVLRGANRERLAQFGLDRAKCFGTVDMPQNQLKEVIELLAAGGYLEITEGKYPLVGFGLRFREAAQPGFKLQMKKVARKAGGHDASASESPMGLRHSTDDAGFDESLFERLRALRKKLAVEGGLAPYMVFGDAALRDMCVRLPQTEDEFLQVNGVGDKKLESYGAAFLGEIAQWRNEGR